MREVRAALEALGLPRGDLHSLPDSSKRFPDGAHYRIEIPSTEGPECLSAILEEADRLNVSVHRVSQGSGIFMLTDDELDRFAQIAAARRVEVSLFTRPNAAWGTSAMARASAGASVASAAKGLEQVSGCLEDARRAASRGFRSVLIADLGVLVAFDSMRKRGDLPGDMQAKISVMLPVTNAATAQLIERLGANTINVATDLTLAELAAIRAAIDIPIDVYIEAPDNIGGFMRHYEIPDIIRVCAPVYLKFGLRNAADVYPSGGHLAGTVLAMSRERVRRARLGLEILKRSGVSAQMSEVGAAGLAVPLPL